MAVLQSCFAIFIGLVLIKQLKQTEATHNLLGSPPLFASQHPNVYIFETGKNGTKQDLILPCSINTSSPTVNYTWFRGDQELPGSMVNGEGSLVIPNITEGDYASREGVDYYCIARDNTGFDVAVRSRTITVFYTYFDGFERMAEPGEMIIEVSIPVALNSEVALECDVLDAKPPPQIKWYNDMGVIQEETRSNRVRFLDGGRYLYLSSLKSSHLERQFYCAVTNVNLNQEILAPTRYVLTDSLTQGILIDYKQIGDLIAFVGNASIEFAYVGGVFSNIINGTSTTLTVGGREVYSLGSIGVIDLTTLRGVIELEAMVSYSGMIAVRKGTLTIHQVPRITNYLQNEKEHFTIEENLMYTCEFEGSPLPNVTFFFNGRTISMNAGVNIVNNTLTIPSPQVSHSGIYQCIVSNEFGDDQAAWLLEIREPISPQVQPYNLTALVAFDDRELGALIVRDNGSTVNFYVDVMADPCPDIVWLFNGTGLGPSDEIFMYNNPCLEVGAGSFNWTFTLSVLLTTATSGSYTAKLTNIAGNVSLPKAYFTLPESVLIIGLFLNETCLKEGSTISLHCNTNGFPRPRIEFQHNDNKIISDTDLYMMEYFDQILITNITMSAAGRYGCIITSESGLKTQISEQFGFCTVPVIVEINRTSNPQTGELFFIECTVDGIPTPTISWMKDGDILNEILDRRIRIVTIPARKYSRVEISEATIDYDGEYECIGLNTAGSASASFLIELQQVPLVPAPLALELIIGITVGVTVLISAALLVVLVLVCVICKLCINDKSSKPQIAGTYSANVAYTGTLEHLRKKPDPLYDTIPYTDPAEVWTNQKAQIYKMAHVYEKLYYEDVERTEQPSKDTTVKLEPGNPGKNISTDDIQVSENDDKDSCDEDIGNKGQINPKIGNQAEQETTMTSVDSRVSKYPCSSHESEVQGNMIKEDIKEELKPNDSVNKDVEMARAGNHEHKPQIYASVSTEHKDKKRKKMLQKQQEEDQKEVHKMEEKTERKRPVSQAKQENAAAEKECNEDEINKANLPKEWNDSFAGHCET